MLFLPISGKKYKDISKFKFYKCISGLQTCGVLCQMKLLINEHATNHNNSSLWMVLNTQIKNKAWIILPFLFHAL
jgi:hypothetical protein